MVPGTKQAWVPVRGVRAIAGGPSLGSGPGQRLTPEPEWFEAGRLSRDYGNRMLFGVIMRVMSRTIALAAPGAGFSRCEVTNAMSVMPFDGK
jgi:hypothetical protein